jgi:hypothetical protein
VTGPRWWCSGRCPPPENPARFRGGVRGAGGTVPSPRASGDRPTPAPGERIFAGPECTPASAWCSMAVRTPAGQRAFRGWVIEHQAVIGPRKMRGNPYAGRGTTGLGPPPGCAGDHAPPGGEFRGGARRVGGTVPPPAGRGALPPGRGRWTGRCCRCLRLRVWGLRGAGRDRARRTPGRVRCCSCSWPWSRCSCRTNRGDGPGDTSRVFWVPASAPAGEASPQICLRSASDSPGRIGAGGVVGLGVGALVPTPVLAGPPG